MKRILVTGANGQLGRSLQEIATRHQKFEFLFLDKSKMDITRPEQILRRFQEFGPEYCINCAAYTAVDQAEKTPERAYAVNAGGVENLIKACLEQQTTLIHISTDYVFDGKKESGYFPADTPNPINVYGKTKLLGEQIIQQSMERYFIIRTSWLYSKKYGKNFYKTILEKAKKGIKLTVTDSQKGCPTNAANLARHILNTIEAGRTDYGISHFTDGEVMSWYGFALKIKEQNNLDIQIKKDIHERYGTLARRPLNSVLTNGLS